MRNGRPVLLIHGFASPKLTLWPLRRRLEAAGIRATQANLPFMNLGGVRSSSRAVGSQVRKLLAHSGAVRCDVVGASIGGLMALYYVKRLGGADYVARVIGVSTPFYGTKLSGLAPSPLRQLSSTLSDLEPGSAFLEELHRDPLPPGVEWFSVSAANDPLVRPSSAHLAGAKHIVVSGLPSGITHQFSVMSDRVAERLIEILRAA